MAKIRRYYSLAEKTGDVHRRQPTTVQDLPNELLEKVLSLLSVEELVLRVKWVCRRWKDLVDKGGVLRWSVYRPFFSAKEDDIVRVLRAAPKLRNVLLVNGLSPALLHTLSENCKELRHIEVNGRIKVDGTLYYRRRLPWFEPTLDPKSCMLEILDEVLRGVNDFPWVNDICVQGPCGDAPLSALAELCPHLERFNTFNAWDHEKLSSFLKCPQREVSLNIVCCFKAKCLVPIITQNCEALHKLTLRHHCGPSEALAQLLASRATERLQELELVMGYIDRLVTTALFINCCHLTHLHIQCFCEIDDALVDIDALTHLETLRLNWNSMLTDRGVYYVTKCKTLRELHLSWCPKISEESLRLCCQNLPDLRWLQMAGVEVSLKLFETVPYCLKRLESLTLHGRDLEKMEETVRHQMPFLNLRLQGWVDGKYDPCYI